MLDTLRWSLVRIEKETEIKPPPMKAHTMCHIGKDNQDILLLFGGGSDQHYHNDVFLFNTRTFRWQKVVTDGCETPKPRRGHTMVYFDNCVYVFGGGSGSVALNDTFRLCLKTFKWKRLETRRSSDGNVWNPPARGYHSATVIDSKMIVYGGCDGSNFFNNLEILDLSK